jgi:hypothetical protein
MPHLSELIAMRENGAEIRRLAEHRSVLFQNEDPYWSFPRASISNDGTYVVATSNVGVPKESYQVILVETPGPVVHQAAFGGGAVIR